MADIPKPSNREGNTERWGASEARKNVFVSKDPGQRDAICDPEFLDFVLELRPELPVTDEFKVNRTLYGITAGNRPQQGRPVLFRTEATTADDQESVCVRSRVRWKVGLVHDRHGGRDDLRPRAQPTKRIHNGV